MLYFPVLPPRIATQTGGFFQRPYDRGGSILDGVQFAGHQPLPRIAAHVGLATK